MNPLPDDINDRIRAAIQRPVDELVALGIQGGALAASHMLAFQHILRLEGAGDLGALEQLRDEIDEYLGAVTSEAVWH
jgi:hypothetical protein